MARSIEALIQQFTTDLRAFMRAELSAEVSAAVQGALGGKAPSKGRSASTAAPRRKGGKRTPEEIESLTKRLLAAIKENEASRSEQLANALGVTTTELVLPIKALLADKKIKAKGVARGTSYTAT